MKPRQFLERSFFQTCVLILSLALIGVPASSSQAAGPGQQETTPGGPAPESPAGFPAEAGSIFEVSCGDSAGLVTAIVTANTNSGADTVVLNPTHQPVCTYTFSAWYGSGPNALPALGDTLTIEGNGATIERSTTGGPPNFRIFEVGAGAVVTINFLTIRNGSIRGTTGTSGAAGATGSEGAPGGYPGGTGSGGGTGSSGGVGGAGGSGQGGAIYVAGSGRLTLHACIVTGNRAVGGTGGAGGLGGTGGSGGRGGDGRDAQCDFFGCGVPATNGGIGGKGGDGGTGGFGGQGGQAQGGGICNAGILSLEGTIVSGNAVTGGAGGAGGRGGIGVLGAVGGQGGDAACYGLWSSTAAGNGGMGGGGGNGGNGGGGGAGGQGNGGGIFNAGTLTMESATITGNHENSGGSGGGGGAGGSGIPGHSGGAGGAAADCRPGPYVWPGVDGPYGSPGARGDDGSGGSGAGSNGGGAYNAGAAAMTVNRSAVTSNSATMDGGGSYSQGTLVVRDATFEGNAANSNGFGAAQDQGLGGAIYQHAGSLAVSGSAISANTANRGGGLAIRSSSVQIANSTLSGNAATGNSSPHGGGIYIWPQSPPSGSLHVSQTTITGNSAPNGHGGGIYHSAATARFKGSIVVGNSSLQEQANDCAYPVATYGYNLGSAEFCGFTAPTDLESNAPRLGPLADNGGRTRTHALLPGSPAIDRGACTDVAGTSVTADQRGITRPQGAACDCGAFEKRNTLVGTGGNGQTAWTGSAFCAALQVSLQSDDPAGYETPAGIALTFTPPNGGAGLSVTAPFIVNTAAGGAASAPATANSVAGAYQVVVTAAGVSVPAVFDLRNAAGLAASIAASPTGGARVTLPYYAGVDYHLWRSSIPYLVPGSTGTAEVIAACTNDGTTETCVDDEPLGSQGGSWYYVVRGSTGCGAPVDSNATGRFGFGLVTP